MVTDSLAVIDERVRVDRAALQPLSSALSSNSPTSSPAPSTNEPYWVISRLPTRIFAGLRFEPLTDNGGASSSNKKDRDTRPIRIVLADDHQILRAGLASLLLSVDDMEVVGEASDGVEAVDLARELNPDVIVMDVTMPRMNGIEATHKITAELPHIRVIGLSMHSESDMGKALERAGATTYLTKGGAAIDLIDAIREAALPSMSPPGQA